MYSPVQLNRPIHGQYFAHGSGDDVKASVYGRGGESIENSCIVRFEDGNTVGGLDGIKVSVPQDTTVYGCDGCPEGVPMAMPRGDDVSNQLMLSFRGQIYMFDAVTAEKGLMDYSGRCNDPKRVESLNRFQQKRKEWCFEKKIQYNVRQEVAMKIQWKKGQFAPGNSKESVACSVAEESGQNDILLETSEP